jgi:hypothetical protein
LVRIVMPELRVLMEHLVSTAVERSISPLLEKQRELEASLAELRSAQLRSSQVVTASARHVVETAPSRSVQAERRPVAPVNDTAVYREPVPVNVGPYGEVAVPVVAPQNRELNGRNNAAATTRSARLESLEDIPSELNGSRRKKFMMVAFAVIVVVLILSVVSLSVLSNMGTHI